MSHWWCLMLQRARLLSLLVMALAATILEAAEDDDDFTPRTYSPKSDVELANKYPHLSTSLQEQDNTFMSNEETQEDYAISLVVFPALVAGICLICVFLFCSFLCFRCCLLGCLNCMKCCCRICKKDCCRKTKEQKDAMMEKRKKWYTLYSRTFPVLLLGSAIAIIWVWVGADYLDNGVQETQGAMTQFGNIVQSISDELGEMSESGRRIDAFLAFNTCPPEVDSYLNDIESSFVEFTNTTDKASKITGSVQPAVDKASNKLEEYWDDTQELAFDMSAAVLFVVIIVYGLGVCMKTAILMRLGILLTIILSFVLCILVFIEMVLVMGYSDFCMLPTYHIERSLSGSAYDVVHYYTTCEGEGPLFKPIDDSQLYNSLMNQTYFDMLTDFPLLSASCRAGASTMEESFKEISTNALNIIDFARCPHINRMYTQLVLDGFCADSYSGLYNIHVSHLTTLVIFFCLMVNASLLYPHFKGQTLKHLCCCCYSKEQLEEADAKRAEYHGEGDVVYIGAYHDAYSDDDDSSDEGDEEMGAQVHMAPVPTTDPDAMNNLEMIALTNPTVAQSVDLSEDFEGETNNVFTFVNPAYGQGGRKSPKNMNSPRGGGGMVRVKADEEPSCLLGDDSSNAY